MIFCSDFIAPVSCDVNLYENNPVLVFVMKEKRAQ